MIYIFYLIFRNINWKKIRIKKINYIKKIIIWNLNLNFEIYR